MNSASKVEELLAQVDEIDPKGASASFTLGVPNSLTLGGNAIAQDVAMAVVLDRVLAKGFFPDGFVAEATGRRFIPIRGRLMVAGRLTNRRSGRVTDKVPSSYRSVRAAQLNR